MRAGPSRPQSANGLLGATESGAGLADVGLRLRRFPGIAARRGADALVGRECLLQKVQAFVVVAILEAGPAESFQRACFLRGRAEVAGDGQCVDQFVIVLAGTFSAIARMMAGTATGGRTGSTAGA